MKAVLFAYSLQGKETGQRIMDLPETDFTAYAVDRLAGDGYLPIPKPSAPLYEEAFRNSDALVFVSSCGIAVRSVAPFLKSKATDPAVVVVDETGRFAVSLLSGHIGGANALAGRIASLIGAVPVVTTATDVNGRFSVDAWAETHGYGISGLAAAKAVSAAILERDVPLRSDFTVSGELPAGLCFGEGETGVSITFKLDDPFPNTLRLIPKCLIVGIGCRRGTPAEAIEKAVAGVLSEHSLDPKAVLCAASVDLKKDEPGLLEYCSRTGWPVRFYSAEALSAVHGSFTASEFVRKVTGTDNVCERAAMAEADELIVRKTAAGGVTVAVGLKQMEVRFG